MPETPTPAPAAPDYDLAALEQRQAALFKALANYQWDRSGDPYILPGVYGLALFHRFEVLSSGKHHLEAVLAHEAGGEISSGLIPIASIDAATIDQVRELSSLLILGICCLPMPSASQQTQTPPILLQQSPAVDSASPERRTGTPVDQGTPSPAAASEAQATEAQEPEPQAPNPEPAPEPETPPPAPVPAAGAAPDEQEVEKLLEQIDMIHGTNPEGVKRLVSMFRDQFRIRTAFARSITTRERADWLAQRIEGLKK